MKKRIISFFTALSMTLMLFTGIPISVSAEDTGECEHRGVSYFSIKEATCTERGTNGRACQCMDCGKYFDINPFLYPNTAKELTYEEVYDLPALGHDFSYLGKDDTYHWYECCRCDEKREKIAHSGGTATCQAKAVCEVCGREYGEKGDHIYNTTWSTNDSYHWHACSLCGAKKDNVSHSGGTATCTKKKVCDICGQEYGYLAAHNYGDYENNDTQHWQVCLNPDCGNIKNLTDHNFVWKKDETGHWHECSVCGYKKDDKESHNIVLWEGREPTCKLIGFTDGLRCSECYYVEKARERLDKTDHTWGDWVVTTPATEETEGEKKHTCSVCDTVETETIPVTGHTFSDDWTSDSTHHWHAATCVHTDEVSDKAVHDWGEGIVTTKPDEDTEGEKTYTCTICSATKTESIGKTEHKHTLTAHDAVPADCTTNGNEAYWTCSGCNKMFSNENGTTEITAIPTIPATGHKFSTEWTSDSTYHWHSATCGHDVTSEAAAHTEDGGTVTVPPTTENDGLKTFSCDVCGYLMRTEVIPKLNEDHSHSFSPDWKHDSTSHWHECDCGVKSDNSVHIENSGVVTTEPTETSTGIMTYSCSVCGYVMRTDVIPALTPEHNHTFGTDWKYDSVSHWHECECGEKSELAGHTSSDWIVETPATTDLEGVQIRKCTVCGIEIDRETIEKLPNISTGDVAEGVQDNAGTNAGLVQDNTLIENVLTPEDKTEVTEGHSFEIVLEVTDIRNSVPADDVAAASSALRYNEQIGIYVDLSLFKIKDNSERTPIYNTSGRIGITLTVPDSIYASDRTYSIIRVHGDKAENLGGTYDKTSRELTFYTDKFSTYAIAYTASSGGTNRPSVPSTPPSGGTTPVSPSVPVVTPTVTETTVKKEEEVISDEPYVEDVSSAAGIYENGETDNSIHYVMILIFATAAGIAAIAAKKHFCKKNMK